MNIKAIGLIKKYKGRKVVDDLSFEIRNGQILGLLGPNGAGKSTTIKMLSGQIKPSGGQIELDGVKYDSVPDDFRYQIGVMPQEVVIWQDLNVKENLEFTGKLYGLSNDVIRKRRDYLIDALNLGKELKTVAKVLSGGFKRRLNLAITIMNEPSAVFLDEPTPGIDPQNRRFLWDYIRNLKSTNRSVILTDHYLDEAEKLADYVVIIDNGKVVATGTMPELRAKYGSGTLFLIHFEDPPVTKLRELVKEFSQKLTDVKVFDNTLSIQTKDAINDVKYVLQQLSLYNLRYKDFQLKEPTLEDIFLILTGKNIRE
jgi:ABC-2 type transport system ATP-binding protein